MIKYTWKLKERRGPRHIGYQIMTLDKKIEKIKAVLTADEFKAYLKGRKTEALLSEDLESTNVYKYLENLEGQSNQNFREAASETSSNKTDNSSEKTINLESDIPKLIKIFVGNVNDPATVGDLFGRINNKIGNSPELSKVVGEFAKVINEESKK